MDEIMVVLTQEPGKLSWNYEEVKAFLAAEMEKYKGIVYDDDTIKTAKGDRAFLNKLSKQIDAKRKEAKERCLEPYQKIEDQATELKSLIEGPVQEIDAQVKAYETRRQEAVKEEIGKYFDEKYTEAGLPVDIRKKVVFKIWDPKWLNATVSKKAWKEGVENGIASVKKDIEAIESFESEFESDMKATFAANLSLQEAIRRMNDLNRQKERILEMERQKQEVAERERIRREQEAEAARIRKENAQKIEENVQPTPESARPMENIDQVEKAQEKASEAEKQAGTLVRIFANDEQLKKILGFVKYAGADYKIEVR